MPRSAGSVSWHVAEPTLVPWLVSEIVATTEPAVVESRMPVTDAANGPIPDTARWATIARVTTASPTATKTVPWTCELAESFSPSGLHRSHSPTSSGTGAPQRAHGWVRGFAAGPVAGTGPVPGETGETDCV